MYDEFKRNFQGFIISAKTETEYNPAFNIKKIAIARDSYALLKESGEVIITKIYSTKSHNSQTLRGCIDIAAGFHHYIGLRKDGTVSFRSAGNQAPKFFSSSCHGAVAVAASEGHSAILKEDGTVCCEDHYSMEMRKYKDYLEHFSSQKRNIKQVVLTFDEPYLLTADGEFFSRGERVNNFFNDGREIVQIAAFGCYYSQMTVASLYADGTVKAFYGFLYDYDVIREVETWHDVKKICCGGHAAVTGLMNDGKVLLPQEYPYRDRENNPVTEIDDACDIAANFNHFIALTRSGKIIYLHDI